MKNRFIVLIDFSEYSANLIRYAYDWSRKEKAEILLVHQTVVAVPAFADQKTRMELGRADHDSAMERLKSLAADALAGNAPFNYEVTQYSLADYLNEKLREPFNHLIFIGIKGTGPLKKFFIGSVAIDVIEQVSSLIVAIPKSVTAFQHRSLFVAINRKSRFNIEEFKRLLSFTGKQISLITFFSVADRDSIESTKQYLAGLCEPYQQHFTSRFLVYESEQIIDELKRALREESDPLLVVQKNSEWLTDTFFRKYIINELIYEGKSPMIVMPGIF